MTMNTYDTWNEARSRKIVFSFTCICDCRLSNGRRRVVWELRNPVTHSTTRKQHMWGELKSEKSDNFFFFFASSLYALFETIFGYHHNNDDKQPNLMPKAA